MNDVVMLPILLCPICGDNLFWLDRHHPPDFDNRVVCQRDQQMFRVKLPRLEATMTPWVTPKAFANT